MKKRLIITVIFITVILTICLLGCGTEAEFKVNFLVDNEIYAIVNTFGQEIISIPETPIKEGYEFEGWFWDNGKWERPFTANSLLNELISNDINIYAKWSINELVQGTQALFDGFLKISETEYEIVVSNSIDKISLGKKVVVNSKSSWSLTSDIYGNFVVASKVATLEEGDNFYYVLVTDENGQCEMYELKIRRKPMYTVSFDTTGGGSVDSQLVEEGDFAVEPTCTREGYSFGAWDYDFATPIMQDVTIKASWSANKETQYKVEYYLQNYEDYEYPDEPSLTLEMSGTTDTNVFAELKEFTHFTLDRSSSILSGNVQGDGSLVLKLFYIRNRYNLYSFDERCGTVQQGGSYAYQPDFSLKVSVKVNRGYEFDGWYSAGICLSTEPEFIYCADKTVQARFKCAEEMENFYFDSTETECVITGIKDDADENLVIPKCVTDIEEYVFHRDGKNVKSIHIENGITRIKSGMFSDSPNLTEVIIDDGIIFIEASAFARCEKLSKIILPNSITRIEESTFYMCTNLSEIIIPNEVTVICDKAFKSCTNLSKVVLSNNLNHIRTEAFALCCSLKSIEFPSSLRIIYDKAFWACENLSSIILNDGITDIYDSVFYKCERLGPSVTLPKSLRVMGNDVFLGCYRLYEIVNMSDLDIDQIDISDSYIVVQSGESQIKNINGLLVIQGQHPNKSDLVCPHIIGYLGEETAIKISYKTIGNYYCVIRNGAFADNQKIVSLTLEFTNILTVESGAFSNCESLENVVFTIGTPNILSDAFKGCTNIKNVYFGSEIEWYYALKYYPGYGILTIATVYYYDDTHPTSEGNYWHYDENGEAVPW